MYEKLKKWLPRIIGTQINLLSVIAPQAASKKAFRLFSAPRKGRLRPQDEQFLQKAEDQLAIQTPNGLIQTYSWNTKGKSTILLMHGWESNAARWQFLIPHLLEQDYHIVAMDAPAHGQSEGKFFHMPKYAESIYHVMQHYQANHLVGHSVGGMAVVYYLSHYDHPEISKMIIMGAPSEFEKMLLKFKDFLGLSAQSTRAIYQHLEKKFGNPPSYFTINEFCADLHIPALIIHDESDLVIPFHESSDYLNNLQYAQLLKTQKFGHSLQNKVVYEGMLTFLNEGVLIKN
jgi:pimeloyl-ACP methyl ester carboxylesterase